MPGAREVLWNAAENVGQLDLNTMQRYARAQVTDWLIGALGRPQAGFAAGAMARTTNLFVVGDAGAPYPHPSDARKVINLGGPIIQWRAGAPNFFGTALPSDWGHDAYALVYFVAPDELTVTHDTGGAQPRWDLVTITLGTTAADIADQESRLQRQVVGSAFVTSAGNFIKKRKVTLTLTVTKGSEAATPNIPVRPVGTVPLYACYVPAAHNAVVDPLNLWDMRMPLGAFSVDVLAHDVHARGAGANLGSVTTVPGAWGAIQGGATNAELYFVPHGPGGPARLVGVQALIGENCNSMDFDLKRVNTISYGSGVPTNIPSQSGSSFPDTSASLRGDPSSGNTEWRGHELATDCDTGDASGLNRFPIWLNGRTSSYAMRPERHAAGTDDILDRVAMRIIFGDTTARMSMLRFHFAGGL